MSDQKRRLPHFLALLSVLLMAACLRFYGLQFVAPNSDESHYRDDLINLPGMIHEGQFREHSVRHRYSHAPHGLLGEYLSLKTAEMALNLLAGRLPPNPIAVSNFLCRLSNAMLSTLSVALLAWLAWQIYGPQAAIGVATIAALSPNLITFGRSEYLDGPMTFFIILAYCFLWASITCRKTSAICLAAVASGIASGLALGVKWSMLTLAPTFPFIFYFTRLSQSPRNTKDTILFSTCFLVGFVAVSFCFHSIESFKWVLFPTPYDQYGDTNYELGLFNQIWQGAKNTLDWRNPVSIGLLWFGPVGLIFLAKAMNQLASEKITLRRRFLWLFFATALGFTHLQGGEYFGWRVLVLISNSSVLCGAVFQRMSRRTFLLAFSVLFATTLPLSIHQGLRLGKPLVPFYGSDKNFYNSYSD